MTPTHNRCTSNTRRFQTALLKWIVFVLLTLAIATLLAGQMGFLSGRTPVDHVVRPDEPRGAGTLFVAAKVI